MAGMICDVCQGKVVASAKEGWFVCEYCDTEYPLEWMKAKFQKTQAAEGTSAENLLARAQEFYQRGDTKRAREYCERILDIDAANEGAKALQKRIADDAVRQSKENQRIKEEYQKARDAIAQLKNLYVWLGGLQWRCLAVKDGQVLCITKDVIEQRQFHAIDHKVTWENSTLRQYLNGELLHRFTPLEQAIIVKTMLVDVGTNDQIFLLSKEEAKNYFSSFNGNSDRQAKLLNDYSKSSTWLLRSCIGDHFTAFVHYDGKICDATDVRERGGVRPAIWLKLESVIELQQTAVAERERNQKEFEQRKQEQEALNQYYKKRMLSMFNGFGIDEYTLNGYRSESNLVNYNGKLSRAIQGKEKRQIEKQYNQAKYCRHIVGYCGVILDRYWDNNNGGTSSYDGYYRSHGYNSIGFWVREQPITTQRIDDVFRTIENIKYSNRCPYCGGSRSLLNWIMDKSSICRKCKKHYAWDYKLITKMHSPY
ncbi:MAG: DUF6273 domain-containing protein [Oscillospiraceae bacterium]|nr:DUF6273 domain-containing protein [Oscillospiraceae bacterium]